MTPFGRSAIPTLSDGIVDFTYLIIKILKIYFSGFGWAHAPFKKGSWIEVYPTWNHGEFFSRDLHTF